MGDSVNILYQFDDPFAPIAGVSITSLFDNNQHIPEMRIYVLDGGISEANKDKLEELAAHYQRSIYFIEGKDIDETLESRGVKKWRNYYAAYYKVYAIELITDDLERLLSLDGDTIINGSIDQLYYSDLDGKTLGMVQDFMPAEYLNSIGFGNSKPYYNSGVILFDVRQWKRQNCHEKIEHFFSEKTKNYTFLEQDALNILFSANIHKLSIRYNYYTVFSALNELLSFDLNTLYRLYKFDSLFQFYSREEVQKAEKNAIVYHYEGGTVAGRPWEKGADCQIYRVWEHYQTISPWNKMGKQESSETRIHQIEKKLNQILPFPVFVFIYKFAFSLYWKIRVLKQSRK